jgi:hypothetical protein
VASCNAVQHSWKGLPLPSPRSEDALPAMVGHAACAVRGRIYIFGGRTGRKQVRRTYIFDTGGTAPHASRHALDIGYTVPMSYSVYGTANCFKTYSVRVWVSEFCWECSGERKERKRVLQSVVRVLAPVL